ncbi:MAG: type III pantothenate kinase [Planctomycetes bacterium]|nr:type III pantothenate kinase [Planctomycetota bacterium]
MPQLDKLLTVDCGNSTIDLRRPVDGARLAIASTALTEAGFVEFVQPVTPGLVLLASVVAPTTALLQQRFAALGSRCLVAGIDVPCPLPLHYDTPATLGCDRWLGALAAHRRFGRAIVVDCGSATTVNVVAADGTFRGGSIAPGLRAMVAGMAAVTPALPAARLDATPEVPARSSQSAVDAGVLLGYCGLVERLVAEHLRVAGGPATVVVTGGNAARLLSQTRLRPQHVPELVHEGLLHLAVTAPWNC